MMTYEAAAAVAFLEAFPAALRSPCQSGHQLSERPLQIGDRLAVLSRLSKKLSSKAMSLHLFGRHNGNSR
jgi:hypothetical protein